MRALFLSLLIASSAFGQVFGGYFPGSRGSSSGGGGSSGVDTLGAVGGTPNANGGAISGTTYTQAPASASFPGAQSASNFVKTNGLTHEKWVVPKNSTISANTAISIVAGRVYLRGIYVPVRGPAAGVGVMTPQAGTLGGSAQVGLYGPIANSGAFTCAGATLVASSVDTSQTTGSPVALGHGWTIAFSTNPTVEPGLYCIALQTNTGVLVTRDSNFYSWEDGLNSRFTTDQATGTTALPGTVPALSTQGSDNPVVALKMQ